MGSLPGRSPHRAPPAPITHAGVSAVPSSVSKRFLEKAKAAQTLRALLAGRTVSDEDWWHMRVYLSEDERASLWHTHAPGVDTSALREWMTEYGLLPPWSRQLPLAEQLQRWVYANDDVDVPTLVQQGCTYLAASAARYPQRTELITRDRPYHLNEQQAYIACMERLAHEAALRRSMGQDHLDGNPLAESRPEHQPDARRGVPMALPMPLEAGHDAADDEPDDREGAELAERLEAAQAALRDAYGRRSRPAPVRALAERVGYSRQYLHWLARKHGVDLRPYLRLDGPPATDQVTGSDTF
jgi:hypothetical protein